jgi:hypothetical protein
VSLESGENCGIFVIDADVYYRLDLTTLREFTMLHIMNSLTDKPHWEEKVR